MDKILKVNINELITEEEFKNIVEEELREHIRDEIRRVGIVEILTRVSYNTVSEMIRSRFKGGDLEGFLRDQIKTEIDEHLSYHIFKRKSVFDSTQSPVIDIMDDELKKCRPLIRECIEKKIREYPFHELDRDEIQDVIYTTICEKILSPKGENS